MIYKYIITDTNFSDNFHTFYAFSADFRKYCFNSWFESSPGNLIHVNTNILKMHKIYQNHP